MNSIRHPQITVFVTEELSSARPILLTIYKKMPPQVPMDGVHKSFAAKYLTCVLYFLECYPDFSNDFTGIIRSYRQFIDVDKEAKEVIFTIRILLFNLGLNVRHGFIGTPELEISV